jgi:hypothetical protein
VYGLPWALENSNRRLSPGLKPAATTLNAVPVGPWGGVTVTVAAVAVDAVELVGACVVGVVFGVDEPQLVTTARQTMAADGTTMLLNCLRRFICRSYSTSGLSYVGPLLRLHL